MSLSSNELLVHIVHNQKFLEIKSCSLVGHLEASLKRSFDESSREILQ